MIENKTIAISIAVILFILILFCTVFKENFMNVLVSDPTGNLSSTPELGIRSLSAANNITANNINATGKIQEGGNALIPRGMIMLWSGEVNAIPAGWVLCNGQNGTPNLQDRFIVGAGSGYGVGAIGGKTNIKLTVDQIPSHTHTATINNVPDTAANSGGCRGAGQRDKRWGCGEIEMRGLEGKLLTATASNTGGGADIDIRPLYYALCYVMKT